MALTSGELGAELQWLLEFADTDLVIEAILHHLVAWSSTCGTFHQVFRSAARSINNGRCVHQREDSFRGGPDVCSCPPNPEPS